MLERIKLDLEDIRIENYYDEKGSEWCANLILLSIEEAGMLPPTVIVPAFGVKDNMWEPEND